MLQMRCVGAWLSPQVSGRPISPERGSPPSSGHWGVGGVRPLAAGSCVGLFLTVPRFTHLEMRVMSVPPRVAANAEGHNVCETHV